MNQDKRIFAETLLSWHEEIDRNLPWKKSNDPYKIWISEIILQQTRVEQGLPYFERIIEKYPTVQDLAAASEDDFLSVWEGLGYYSRARNMLETARKVSDELSGVFPGDYAGLLSLKGIGPYTAAAIASFAFKLPHAVADGNVFRVLSRYFGIFDSPDTSVGKKVFAELATSLIPERQSPQYNQAIMDFGALVCKPFSPLCGQCPLNQHCYAIKHDTVETLPVKVRKPPKRARYFTFLICREGSLVLCRKRTGSDIWKGLYELPSYESETYPPDIDTVMSKYFSELSIKPAMKPEFLGSSKQILSHQIIHGAFFEVRFEKLNKIKGYQFFNLRELSNLPFPKILRNFIDEYVNLRHQ
jgi:A/G-specific adenine glycosylase